MCGRKERNRKIREAVMCPYRLQDFSEISGKLDMYSTIKLRFNVEFNVEDIAEIRFLEVYADDRIVDVLLIDRDGDAHCFPTYDFRTHDFVW